MCLNAVMQSSRWGNAFREMPDGARHEVVEMSNSLQSGCAENV